MAACFTFDLYFTIFQLISKRFNSFLGEQSTNIILTTENDSSFYNPSEKTLVSSTESESISETAQEPKQLERLPIATWKTFTTNYVYDFTTNLKDLKNTFKKMDELDAKIVESTYLKRLVSHHSNHGQHVSRQHALETNNLNEKFDFNGLDVIDLTKLCASGEFQVPPPPLQFSDDYQNNDSELNFIITSPYY